MSTPASTGSMSTSSVNEAPPPADGGLLYLFFFSGAVALVLPAGTNANLLLFLYCFPLKYNCMDDLLLVHLLDLGEACLHLNRGISAIVDSSIGDTYTSTFEASLFDLS